MNVGGGVGGLRRRRTKGVAPVEEREEGEGRRRGVSTCRVPGVLEGRYPRGGAGEETPTRDGQRGSSKGPCARDRRSRLRSPTGSPVRRYGWGCSPTLWIRCRCGYSKPRLRGVCSCAAGSTVKQGALLSAKKRSEDRKPET